MRAVVTYSIAQALSACQAYGCVDDVGVREHGLIAQAVQEAHHESVTDLCAIPMLHCIVAAICHFMAGFLHI